MLKAFCIFDAAAAAAMRPFFAHNAGAAIREFTDIVNNPEHPIGRHPEDYTLFAIGEFDERNGVLTGSTPASLGNGLSHLRKPQLLEEVSSG